MNITCRTFVNEVLYEQTDVSGEDSIDAWNMAAEWIAQSYGRASPAHGIVSKLSFDMEVSVATDDFDESFWDID
jgi:hypothetical protein